MVPLTEGSLIAGKYRLERLLARGGMGAVWRGHHLPLDIKVAIKLMKVDQSTSPTWQVRFKREARAAAQLKIPNVVQVYDYGLEGDVPYMVMELLDGEDLASLLRRQTRLSPAETLTLVDQVCRALSRAHAVGLVHRDLKPANIFLSRQGEAEVVKILDFGIAKFTGPEAIEGATETGTLLGSPHYMSPEQVRNSKHVDHRSDLWSMGVIIFRCLTGELPFPGTELGDVLVYVCTEPVPLPSKLVPDLSPAIDRFVLHALTRKLDGRFQSAEEMARAFADAVAGRMSAVPAGSMEGLSAEVIAGALLSERPPKRMSSQAQLRTIVALAIAIVIAAGLLVTLLMSKQRPEPAAAASASGASPQPARAASAVVLPEASATAGVVGSEQVAAAPAKASASAPAATAGASAASTRPPRPAKSAPASNQTPPRIGPRKGNDPLNEM